MKTPADKQIAFTFMSHPTKDLKMRWRAVLTFPPGAGPETLLPLEFFDGEETPIDNAVFEFAGQRLKVAGGKSAIVYADFIAGIHSVPLWLHRPGTFSVPGGMTFV